MHNRTAMRFRKYDYAIPGAYFITVVSQDRILRFGNVNNGVMHLNEIGSMVKRWYEKLPSKFPNVRCGEYVVMPNHFHAIIHMTEGTAPRGCPENIADGEQSTNIQSNNQGSLFEIMDWFKTMTTNEYIRNVKQNKWPRFYKRIWQHRYWDHIIRNEEDYNRIRTYIINNPRVWHDDRFHT